MLVLEWKERTFIEKLKSRCFCWFPAAILVHQNGTPIWRLHAKLYKDAWNVSANNSETVGHKDLRLGQIVYILVFYNISFSWLLPLDGFQFIFLLRDSETWHIRTEPRNFDEIESRGISLHSRFQNQLSNFFCSFLLSWGLINAILAPQISFQNTYRQMLPGVKWI